MIASRRVREAGRASQGYGRIYIYPRANPMPVVCASHGQGQVISTEEYREDKEVESGIWMIGMTMKRAKRWDASEYLETETDIAAYLNAALEDGDTSVIAAALGDVARAKGMTQLAKETGITRDGLYKALSPTGNPSFDTVQKVIKAFGLKFDVAAASA